MTAKDQYRALETVWHMWVVVWGAVCAIDINASTVDAPAAALYQTTGEAQGSAVHSWVHHQLE